jgi:hypothetical protein
MIGCGCRESNFRRLFILRGGSRLSGDSSHAWNRPRHGPDHSRNGGRVETQRGFDRGDCSFFPVFDICMAHHGHDAHREFCPRASAEGFGKLIDAWHFARKRTDRKANADKNNCG